MLRKISLSLPHLFCNAEFGFSCFRNTKQSSEILILKIEMLLEFKNRRILKLLRSSSWFWIRLGFVRYRFAKYRLVRYTHIYICEIQISPFFFFLSPRRLEDVFRKSSRHVFKLSSIHVFKTSSRRLTRCLQDVLEDEKFLRWGRVEDVFKTSWRSTNVCWVTKWYP